MSVTASAARKYKIAVILVGVVGVLLMGGFIVMAGSRIEALDGREWELVAKRRARALRNMLLSARAEALETPSTPLGRVTPLGSPRVNLDPWKRESWEHVALFLPTQDLSFGDVSGFAVRHPAGQAIYVHGTDASLKDRAVTHVSRNEAIEVSLLEDASILASFFLSFEEDDEAKGCVVAVYMTPVLPADRREELSGFLTFGLIALLTTLYLLTAVTLLLNRAQARLAQREREKATRLRAMGEVAGGIAHEVRNPLNAISLSVQYLQRIAEKRLREPSPSDYARIHLELGKIRKVVDNFVKFARIRDLVVGPMDVGKIMEEALGRYRPDLQGRGIALDYEAKGDLSIVGDQEKIREVFAAILQNALDAMRDTESGEVRVRVRADRREVRVSVRDSGEVTEPGAVANIFEPYFTSRDSAMGLGMTVAKTLVESHGGTIEAAIAQGGGCVVTLVLPRNLRA